MGLVHYDAGTRVSGESGNHYEIVSMLNMGGMAWSYVAQAESTGEKVLLKTYSEPAPEDPAQKSWFGKYHRNQEDIRTRLNNISDYAIRIHDHFVLKSTYHQVIQWADGRELGKIIEDKAAPPDAGQLMAMARVMAYAVGKVHEQGIVHEDLKPDNIWMQEAPELGLRYRVKVGDFDWSFLAGKPTPWPGNKAGAGTEGYRSPEHMRGECPTQASDVFTLGLMLSEVLLGEHPLNSVVKDASSVDEMNTLILNALKSGSVPRPDALNPARAAALPMQIKNTIWACLASNGKDRPTAGDVHKALIESKDRYMLALSGGPAMLIWRIQKNTCMDRKFCKQMFNLSDAAAGYISSKGQAVFEPSDDYTQWFVTPVAGATNACMIDKHKITGKTELIAGSRFQIGNPATGSAPVELLVGFEHMP